MMTELEALRERHSVRSYQHKKISAEDAKVLNELIAKCNEEGNIHLQLLDAGDSFKRLLSKVMGLATAPSVIACVGKDDETLDERIGYYGQKVVLCAQQLGLNTCWAGTYNAKSVPAEIKSGERLAIVIAIGYGQNNGRVRKSKTIEQVFRGNINEMPDWVKKGAEAALLAPTAINQQKFEIVMHEDNQVEIVDKGGVLSKIDKGSVKHNFEGGARH